MLTPTTMTSLAAAQKVTARARSKKVSTAKKANRMPMLKFETPLSSAVAYVARDDHFLKIGYRRPTAITDGAAAEYQYPLACFSRANTPTPSNPFLFLMHAYGIHACTGSPKFGFALGKLLQQIDQHQRAGLLVYRYVRGPAASITPPRWSASPGNGDEDSTREKLLLPTAFTAHVLDATRRHFAHANESWYAAAIMHDALVAKGLVADYDN